MEQFRVVVPCDACDALHVVTGQAPRGPMTATIAAFSCMSCGRGYCRTPLPAEADSTSLRIELKPSTKAS
jgi:hypothetical protein